MVLYDEWPVRIRKSQLPKLAVYWCCKVTKTQLLCDPRGLGDLSDAIMLYDS